ncbi:Eco57I restriction-modification methylase domain-containing protein (plasmid) [Cetobacterium somerae]|uniref:Eco57I restriction-modification methylase domain-containing protein n=1 Tax=Cetobacterium somerae TaxID=188913 RepID=UPI001F06D055|nr:Eco57I restriction-modification methylase domain-containing protein [Cetobacterium somerae]UPO98399.1 Eco57I restriction-modification methylase domain-containing protein [Cetobacterium somerae]
MDFSKILQTYFELIDNFFENKNMDFIKENSQYFTPINIVDKMLEDLEIQNLERVKILDPACGCGILLIKLLERLLDSKKIKIIEIDAYDIDYEALNITKKIINDIAALAKIKIKINLYDMDFLKVNIERKYNYIISNPPYKKTNKDLVEQDLTFLINGQPNLYHLFIGKSLKLLEKKGKYILVSPKNYLSGKYTEKLREFILKKFSITKLHTFNERSQIFGGEIIQEVCISHIENIKKDDVIVSYNGNEKIVLNMNKLILDADKFIIMTPRNLEDVKVIELFNNIKDKSIGNELFMRVGKVVQFRVHDRENSLIEEEFNEIENEVPLLVYRHINEGKINYRQIQEKNKNRAITLKNNIKNQSILVKNSNYVILRKNIEKKNKKIIMPVLYLKNLECDKLGIDNNLSYFTNINDNLSMEEAVGIFCIINSEQFDTYYRMINSSHTLNVYELESMKFPPLSTIKRIGEKYSKLDLTVKLCTDIVKNELLEKRF